MRQTETAMLAILHALHEDLPAYLDEQASEPFEWLERREDGSGHDWQSLRIKLPPPEEIWTEQHHTILNYPCLILFYQDSSAVNAADECEEEDITATFFLDVLVTHRNPDALTFLWLRYVEAIRALLRSKNFPFSLELPATLKTESGPQDSDYLRRGLLQLSISFEE